MIPLLLTVLALTLWVGRQEFAEILAAAMSRFFR
jgi:hypothetical protein